MKRIKLLLVVINIFMFSVISIFPVFAEDKPRVIDDVGILSKTEIEHLTNNIDSFRNNYEFDLVVLIVNELDGKSAQAYADDYYDYNDYGYGNSYDGALLLISVAERKWAVSTCGEGVSIFNDSVLDDIEFDILNYLSHNNYYKACDAFIEIANDALVVENTFPLFSRIVISLVIGLVIAFFVVTCMKGQLKSVKRQLTANVYTKPDSMNLTVSNDVFLYSHVSRRAKPKNNNGSHTSSSGRSHGGRSGSF